MGPTLSPSGVVEIQALRDTPLILLACAKSTVPEDGLLPVPIVNPSTITVPLPTVRVVLGLVFADPKLRLPDLLSILRALPVGKASVAVVDVPLLVLQAGL